MADELSIMVDGLAELVTGFIQGSAAVCNVLRAVETKSPTTGKVVSTEWLPVNIAPLECVYYGKLLQREDVVAGRVVPLGTHTFGLLPGTDVLEKDRIQLLPYRNQTGAIYAIQGLRHHMNAGLMAYCSLID